MFRANIPFSFSPFVSAEERLEAEESSSGGSESEDSGSDSDSEE